MDPSSQATTRGERSSTPPMPVLVGFDGSIGAATAIDVAARLLPDAVAEILYLWQPPFASAELRHRLMRDVRSVDELIEATEREGLAEAERVASAGAVLARAAGWRATSLIRQSFGGEGYQFARLAEQHGSALVVVGSRGLSGMGAILGSTSDVVVHLSRVPVLVVPQVLTSVEREAAASGPVLVGVDGSTGSAVAEACALELFPGRTVLRASVDAPTDADDAASAAPTEGDAEDGPACTARLKRRRGGARGVAEALAEHAAQRDAGVVVVGSRGRSAARELLLGTVALAVVHHGQRPVLVVPSPPRTG